MEDAYKYTELKINQIIEHVESDLLTQAKIQFSFDRKWSRNFLDGGGVYAIFDNDNLVYIGESASVRKRMQEVKRTVNHSFRKKLGRSLFNEKEKKGFFTPKSEKALDEYYLKNISFAFHEVPFGRIEIETELIKRNQEQMLNSVGKRSVKKVVRKKK